MTTHTNGNRKYSISGTSVGSSISLKIAKEFKSGRRVPARNKPRAVERVSSSIENRAKLTENRLSIL
jgi:hypothetical protein